MESGYGCGIKSEIGSRRPLNPDPDTSCFLTLPGINIKLFRKESIERNVPVSDIFKS